MYARLWVPSLAWSGHRRTFSSSEGGVSSGAAEKWSGDALNQTSLLREPCSQCGRLEAWTSAFPMSRREDGRDPRVKESQLLGAAAKETTGVLWASPKVGELYQTMATVSLEPW